jgi:hypothetical protein
VHGNEYWQCCWLFCSHLGIVYKIINVFFNFSFSIPFCKIVVSVAPHTRVNSKMGEITLSKILHARFGRKQ